MFINSENVRLKNFFRISDFLAQNGPSDRKNIANGASLSYITVTKAIENLLDIGLITELKNSKSFVYALSSKIGFLVFDLTDDRLVFKLCSVSGEIKETITYNPSDIYFYDENLSFFMKDLSAILKRRHKNLKLIGASALLPDNASKCHGTKSIIANYERLSKLIKSYFHVPCTLCVCESKACALLHVDETDLVIRYNSRNVLCFRTDSNDITPTVLKSENSSEIKFTSKGVSAFAREIAYAVGNTCMILKPNRLYFDGNGIFDLPSFKRTFQASLSEFTCLKEETLPKLVFTKGTLPLAGCAAEIRHEYIRFSLEK